MTRVATLLAALCLGAISSPASAGWISRQSLVQYQYSVDVDACNFMLANGMRVEFAGVFANEPENVVLHELVVLGIPTEADFQFNSMVRVALYDEIFDAKVVKVDDKMTFFALDSKFLGVLWSSNDDLFEIRNLNAGAYSENARFSLPDDRTEARNALSQGVSCYETAVAID